MRRRMDEYKSLVVLSARLAHSWKGRGKHHKLHIKPSKLPPSYLEHG